MYSPWGLFRGKKEPKAEEGGGTEGSVESTETVEDGKGAKRDEMGMGDELLEEGSWLYHSIGLITGRKGRAKGAEGSGGRKAALADLVPGHARTGRYPSTTSQTFEAVRE